MAFVIAMVLTPPLIVALRRSGILDVPNERSSHSRPTPRGGGLAPIVGMAVALLLVDAGHRSTRVALVIAIVLFGFLGFGEDIFGVPVAWRLALQFGAAGLLVPWLLRDIAGPVPVRAVAVLIAVLFVTAYVNAFNFMDGINGISVAQVVAAGSAWYFLGRAEDMEPFATAGAVVGAAALAFAPFNFPKAQVFLGDVGSYAFGALLAILAVLGIRSGLPFEAVVAPISIYLADTGTTLVRRFLRGESWSRPHRDHTYQQLVCYGWSHATVTLTVAALALSISALGALSLLDRPGIRAVANLFIVLMLGGYLALPRLLRRTQRMAVQPG
jgi:UDP-GlcNAc:undecaprenyl-phosphate/decaprenyl-phosphate GlcNAc-1-phosphate transferase